MNRRLAIFIVFTALAAAHAAAAAPAAEIDHADEYGACMDLASRDPEEAFDKALAWRDLGGGNAARHCVAKALMGLGQYDEAARRFEALAQGIKAEPAFKAQILGHAAQAWLMDGETERAREVLAAALKLKPGDIDLLVDRAVVLATQGKYQDAIKDLDRAIAGAPFRAEVLVFRASARRRLGDLESAETDVARALALDVNHPDGLLERGILRRLRGDDDGARRDWLKVLGLVADGPLAEAARANIEKMDVKAR